MKQELTKEQKEFELDWFTLNRDFEYWLIKSGCMWNLKETNKEYRNFRLTLDHGSAMDSLKRKMFSLGKK